MVNYALPLYQNPQETWNEKKCKSLVNHLHRDGLGTAYPFRGYFHFGGHNNELVVHYNGGCEREGRWWQGEQWTLPKVADGYEIVHVPTWGWRLVKKPLNPISMVID